MDYTTLTCCSLAFILYYNTLEAGFVYDDRRAILSNPDLLPTTSWRQLFDNDFWGTPLSDSGSHGSYRPLCVLSFRFNYMLNGFQPWGYHLVNVMLHCMATALLIRVARTILPKSRSFFVGPLATGLAFASHPIHTEAVAGIVGRADLAACNLYLLSFLIYVAHTKYRKLSCNNKIHHKSFTSDRQNPYNNGNGSSGSNSSSSGKQDDPLKQLHKFNSKIVTNFKTKLTNCSWPNGVIRREQCESLMSGQKKTRKHVHGTDDGNNVCCRLLLIKEWGCLFVCIMFAVAAMLSKETGVTVLGVCILYDILISTSTTNHNRRQWRSILVLMVAVTLMLLFRLQTRAPQFSTADNPTAKESKLLTRFLTFVYLPAFNFFLLVYPNVLSFDWGMDVIPRITTMQDPRNLLTVVFYLTLCLTVRQCIVNGIPSFVCGRRATVDVDDRIKKHCPCPVCHHSIADMQHSASCRSNNNNNSMNLHSSCLCLKLPKHVTFRHRTRMYNNNVASLLALGFLTIPFLPATNLFFYVGFVIAERVLYIPSVGLCLMIGLGAAKLWNFKRHRSVVCVSLFVLIVAFGGRTITRNRDWLDEESLYRSAIPVNSPKAFGNLGSVLSSQGRIVEAEWAFRQALLHRPNMADVHYNLGVLLQGKQQLNEAILSFQRAIHFRPSLALAYVNLGAALIAAGRCQEAVSVLRQGSRLDGTGLRDRREHETARVSALLQLGALYSDQGRLQRALAAYREAAHSLPEHYPPQSVFNVLGETLARLHQDEEAERWYQAALNAQPDHVPAHITYGKLLAKNISRIAEAEQWFRRAQRLAPDDPSVYHHYGEFLASRRRHKEAAVLYEKSAELRPNDYELAVAAATAMRQAGRYHDAERWYRKAVIIKPTDARGHTNLGAILHLNGKYMEAADSYREALRLQPNDVTTLTNLHKLHSVMT